MSENISDAIMHATV